MLKVPKWLSPPGLWVSPTTLFRHVYVPKMIEFAFAFSLGTEYLELPSLVCLCHLLKNFWKFSSREYFVVTWPSANISVTIQCVIPLPSHTNKARDISRWIVRCAHEWFSFFPIWLRIHFIEVIKARYLGDVSSEFTIKKASHKLLLPTGMFH